MLENYFYLRSNKFATATKIICDEEMKKEKEGGMAWHGNRSSVTLSLGSRWSPAHSPTHTHRAPEKKNLYIYI